MLTRTTRYFQFHLRQWAPLPIRLIVGYGFIAHGVAKVMRGPEHFGDVLQKLGIPMPHLAAWGTILVELLGGFAVLLGAFVSLASVPMIVVLLVAIFSVHFPYGFSSVKLKEVTPSGPIFGKPGYEVDLLYIAGLLMLVFGGPGPLAVRHVMWVRRGTTGRFLFIKGASNAHAAPQLVGTINIRAAEPGDAEEIARRFLESAAFHADFDERYAVPRFETISERYKNGAQHLSARSGEAITFVAEQHTEIVGFVDARLEKSCDPMHRDLTYCYIADLAVTPQHQNAGVGTRLLEAAERWGREQGAEFASLEYHVANTRAGALYGRRMSYRIVSMFAIKRL